MKRIVYLLALLFCFAGCKKQEVNERMEITRISFENNTKLQADPLISYDNKKFEVGKQIPTTLGDNRVRVYDNISGDKLIDTTLNVKGPQTFYVYQPFDIVAPVIVSVLPDKPPVDPRNPLKNATAAQAGYMKIMLSLKTQFILPNQNVDVLVYSVTAASPGVAVPIETLHNVGVEYNTVLFEVKRPILADGSLSETFTFGLTNPNTGVPYKNGGGTTFTSAALTLPVGENNLFMFYMEDTIAPSRSSSIAFPVDGKYYLLKPTLLWSIQ